MLVAVLMGCGAVVGFLRAVLRESTKHKPQQTQGLLAASQLQSLSLHHLCLEVPYVSKGDLYIFAHDTPSHLNELLLDVLLTCALYINVMTLAACKVAGDGLAETVSAIHARAMDQKRVKEYGVTLFHRQVKARDCWIKVSQPKVQLIHTSLPLWVRVRLEVSLVCTGEDHQGAVLSVNVLHGSPGAHDALCRPEREEVEILVQWMSRRLLARIGRLVDEHAVNSHDVRPCEGLHILQHLWKLAVLKEDGVLLKVLDLGDGSLILSDLGLGDGYVSHDRYCWDGDLPPANPLKTIPVSLQVFICHQPLDDNKSIVFIEGSLLWCQNPIVQSVPELG